MSEILNNSASTSYKFNGSSTVNSATSNVLPINFESSTGLILTKSASPTTFLAGDIITYTVTIKNSSSQFLNGVRIIDNLGGGNLAYVLSSAMLSYNGLTYAVTPVATNPLTFTLQELPVGATMTLTYRCQVIFNLPSTVSLITNTIQGIGYTSTGTITGFANCTIEKKTNVDFSITKTADVTDVEPNETFNYYLTLRNNTGTLVHISSVTDNLPNSFKLVSVKLKIDGGSTTTLSASDYTLSSANHLTIPSSTGPAITVPANGTTDITLTGYFS